MVTTQKAAVLSDFKKPIEIKYLPVPTAEPGSVIIKVLATHLLDYTKDILNGNRQYPLALPLTPGGSCVGRIHATGPDTTIFEEGQLVICDSTVRARDEPSNQFLMGVHSGFGAGSQKLMEGPWRNGSMAQFVKMPLENVFALDEEALCKTQGYDITELPILQTLMIPFGGLDDAGVKVGDTVIVAPATGKFGGAAVLTALSMGATVIACGRNEESLSKLTKSMGSTSLKTLKLASDVQQDHSALKKLTGPKGADVYIDFSPPAAGADGKTPTYMTSCIRALKRGGTCSLMGGLAGNIALPHMAILFNNLIVRGKFMYERDQAMQIIKMAETGRLKFGKAAGAEVVGPYGLDKIEEALQIASELPGWGKSVALVP